MTTAMAATIAMTVATGMAAADTFLSHFLQGGLPAAFVLGAA